MRRRASTLSLRRAGEPPTATRRLRRDEEVERAIIPGVLTVTVDNRLRLPIAEIPPGLVERLMEEFTHANPDVDRAKRLQQSMPWIKLPPAAVATWQRTRDELSLPRGGMNRVREILFEAGVPYRALDRRDRGERVDLPPTREALWDFQAAIVARGGEVEQGLIRSPTGSGKTTAALALASSKPVRWLIVVWTKALFDQWVRRLQKELGLSKADIGEIRGQKRRVGLITVGMQQTLAKCVDDFAGVFGGVICDEVHKFAAKTFLAVVDRLGCRYRFGFSDDERRKDRKEFLVYDVFGDVILKVDRQGLVDRNIIHEVELRVVPTEFRAPWYEELGDLQKAEPGVFDELLKQMMVDADRNRVVVDLAAEEAHAGERVLVFSHRVDHCHRLLADVAQEEPRVGLLIGGDEFEADFEATRNQLDTGECRVGVGTYQAIGTGIDLPSVSRGVCATPIHSNRPFFSQVRGRICRVDRSAGATKGDAVLYYLWDRRIYGVTSLRNLVRWSKRARVLEGGQWVDGREFLKRMERGDEAKRDEAAPGFNLARRE